MDFKKALGALYQDAKKKYNIQQAPNLLLKQDE